MALRESCAWCKAAVKALSPFSFNPGMKSFYKMAQGQTGILVTRVYKGSPAEGKVKSGDVILSVAGHSVADDGTVEFRPRERTI